jgi:hypothetical protein
MQREGNKTRTRDNAGVLLRLCGRWSAGDDGGRDCEKDSNEGELHLVLVELYEG